MKHLRLAVGIAATLAASLLTPGSAEISAPGSAPAVSPETSYRQCIAEIHKALTADQLPAFAHSSPLNKIKLADSKAEEREIIKALKEMTPRTLKEEGKVEFGNKTYMFFEGDPEQAARNKEYFPVTVEMVKEDGKWKLRRQQSWHVANNSPEAEVIPHGAARVRRFQDMMTALTKPIPAQTVRGTIGNKQFRGTGALFYPRDDYFKLEFTDGVKKFAVYIREHATLAELQGRRFQITPLDGWECDLQPDGELFAPYCAKIEFGKCIKGLLPGTISLVARNPEPVNIIGCFAAQETEDTLTPDKE